MHNSLLLHFRVNFILISDELRTDVKYLWQDLAYESMEMTSDVDDININRESNIQVIYALCIYIYIYLNPIL